MASNKVAFTPLPVAEIVEDANNQQQPSTTDVSPPVAVAVTATPQAAASVPATILPSEQSEPVYRGEFSTSICEGLFADPLDRTSCCALTCCATFLQDRNRHIVSGSLPENLWRKRIGLGVLAFIVAPVILQLPLLVWIAAIVVLGVISTTQRQALRLRIMREIIQQQEGNDMALAQNLDDCGCFYPRRVHRMCSCVGKDRLQSYAVQQSVQRPVVSTNNQRDTVDCCSGIWKFLSFVCCGCCGCWFNCWGACATAQEHRELRLRLPKEKFQADYVTMQPYSDYYPSIKDIKERTDYSFLSHLKALSKLSRNILGLFGGLLALIAAIVLLNGSKFPVARLVIVGATLGQAILVLYIVHWRKHRFDLSLDAVIKLFGTGFVFATGIAMIVETITSVFGYIAFLVAIIFETVEDGPDDLPSSDDDDPNFGLHLLQTMAKKHVLTFIIFVAFNAFVVAGLTEELSKYFCFWMVEHPDYPDERDDDGDALEEKGVHATAAAITCGMVATASGFACSENFLYVFGKGMSIGGGM